MLIRIGDRVDSIEVQSFEIDNFDHLPLFASIYAEWFGGAAASPIHLLKSRRAIDARGIKWMIAIVVDVVLYKKILVISILLSLFVPYGLRD